jgi:hypothetical protein
MTVRRMNDDDHDPNMYPRSMEIVGRVVLIVVGAIIGTVSTLLFLGQILMLVPSTAPLKTHQRELREPAFPPVPYATESSRSRTALPTPGARP